MHGLNRPIARRCRPSAQRRPKFSVHHGVELVDEYAWLRADNWQDVMRDPAVLDPADPRLPRGRERLHARPRSPTRGELQEALFAEMKARIKEDDSSVPAPDGPFEYYVELRHRRPVSAARAGARAAAAPRQILLDGNAEAEGKPYWQLGATAHSPDHRSSPTPSTTRARSSSPSASATWRPARTCPTPSPTRAARSSGPATARRCSTCASTTTSARCSSIATASARPASDGRARLRGEGHRLLRRRRPDAVGASSSSSTRTTTRRTRST